MLQSVCHLDNFHIYDFLQYFLYCNNQAIFTTLTVAYSRYQTFVSVCKRL